MTNLCAAQEPRRCEEQRVESMNLALSGLDGPHFRPFQMVSATAGPHDGPQTGLVDETVSRISCLRLGACTPGTEEETKNSNNKKMSSLRGSASKARHSIGEPPIFTLRSTKSTKRAPSPGNLGWTWPNLGIQRSIAVSIPGFHTNVNYIRVKPNK